MLVAAAGLLILQALSVEDPYLTVILPALTVMGLGVGLLFTAAISTSTLGVARDDTGAAADTAAVHGYHVTFAVAAVVLVAVVLICGLLCPSRARSGHARYRTHRKTRRRSLASGRTSQQIARQPARVSSEVLSLCEVEN